MTTHFSRLHYIQKSCTVCVFAKKWPRCIRLHSNANVTGERRSSHINVSTLICFISSFSLFSPQSNFRSSVFSLSECDLFPWSERKGWSQLRFANVFLITESGGKKGMQIYFITLHSISDSKKQKRTVLPSMHIYKLKMITILEHPLAKHIPMCSTRLELADHAEVIPKIWRWSFSTESSIYQKISTDCWIGKSINYIFVR